MHLRSYISLETAEVSDFNSTSVVQVWSNGYGGCCRFSLPIFLFKWGLHIQPGEEITCFLVGGGRSHEVNTTCLMVTFSSWIMRIWVLPEYPGWSRQWNLDCPQPRGSCSTCLTEVVLIWFLRRFSCHLGWSTWAVVSRERHYCNVEWQG